tara:strand:- start:425 stop:1354 length:930 start_codon:yes stop_codon:yes gene_type:complete
MSNPKLALIPSGYEEEKVYSILPSNGDGDLQFDRESSGTRVNKDGLIETMATDFPRLDWLNSDCPSLLIETLRTNRQIRSEEIDNAAWTKTGTTVTANQVISPTGELSADKLIRTSTSANYVSDASAKSSSAQLDITTSVFVKQGEGDFFAFRSQGSYPNRGEAIYQFSTNTLTTSVAGSNYTVVASSVENYGNGWYRLSATFNTDAAATVTSLFSPRATSGVIDGTDTSTTAFAYVWGIQVEEGNSLSSYIKTTSAAVTREADVSSVTTPSGVTQIVETFSDNTTNTITSIPGTYTVSNGKVKKVIMT